MIVNKAPDIYQFESFTGYLSIYFDYLRSVGEKGQKSKFAKCIGTHSAYVTQILNEQSFLSLEQAERATTFFKSSEREKQFMYLLVLRDRVGTQSLKDHYSDLIRVERKKNQDLKERLNYQSMIDDSHKSIYYSSWIYAAIHVLISIKSFSGAAEISKELKVEVSKVQKALDFLESIELIKKVDGAYKQSVKSIHLGNDSPLIASHHRNWRLKSMEEFDREDDNGMFYSSVISISKDDLQKVHTIMIAAIEKIRDTVRESDPECVACYNLDLFRVSKGDS